MLRFHNGSTLLMVICFTGLLSCAALGVWRTTMYTAQAAHDQAIQAQLFRSTEGLLNLAIELGIENFDQLTNNGREISVGLPGWCAVGHNTYEGSLLFLATKEAVAIQVQLLDGVRKVYALRCTLVKKSSQSFAVQAWAIDMSS